MNPNEDHRPIQLDHNADRPPQDRNCNDLFQEARGAFDAHNYEKCLNLVQAAIRLDDNQAPFHGLLAKALDQTGGDKRQLVRALETTLRLDPKDVDATILLAQTFQGLGMHAKASRLWGVVNNLAPNHPIFAPPPKEGHGTAALQGLGDRFSGLLADAREAAERLFHKK